MAAKPAMAVHDGISYDFEVHADAQGPNELAQRIQRHFFA